MTWNTIVIGGWLDFVFKSLALNPIFRSYLGLTCLVQISSEKKDFLIDPLNIWAEMTLLNEITANPKIVKVKMQMIYSSMILIVMMIMNIIKVIF